MSLESPTVFIATKRVFRTQRTQSAYTHTHTQCSQAVNCRRTAYRRVWRASGELWWRASDGVSFTRSTQRTLLAPTASRLGRPGRAEFCECRKKRADSDAKSAGRVEVWALFAISASAPCCASVRGAHSRNTRSAPLAESRVLETPAPSAASISWCAIKRRVAPRESNNRDLRVRVSTPPKQAL